MNTLKSNKIDEEYKELFLKIHGISGDPMQLSPILRKYEEFSTYGGTPEGLLSRDKVIHYINYMYSAKSPLIKNFKENLMERKNQAARLAGFDMKKNSESEKVVSDLFEMQEAKIFKMIMRFIMIQKNTLLSSIVTAEQAFYEFQAIIARPLEGADEKKVTEAAKNKKRLMDDCDEIKTKLKGYYKEFFGDNIDLEAAYKTSDLMLTTPEEIATINRSF